MSVRSFLFPLLSVLIQFTSAPVLSWLALIPLISIFVPEDETCFLFYEAVSVEAVRMAGRLAQLPFDHVAETAGDSTVEGSTA